MTRIGTTTSTSGTRLVSSKPAWLAAYLLTVAAVAAPATAAGQDTVTTVDGRDYPVCAVEDCSDQAGQIGVWFNDGRAWLSTGETSVEVVR